MKQKVLVIDDEAQLRKALSRIIELEGYEVYQAGNAFRGLKILNEVKDIMLVICDVKLPDINGLEVLGRIKQTNYLTEVILLTAYGTIHDGVFAMKKGAFDYITKGDGDEQILVTVEKAVEKAKMNHRLFELENKLETRYSFERIAGNSRVIKETIRLAQKVAPTDSTVLIEGETGTGKELFAQSIHNASLRKHKSFVAVNCSAFPKELLESEIFGHKKGAFTGAAYDKKGLFEEAHEGTLFLDEIGEMPSELQAKLLRVLEEHTFTKIGDTKPTKVNVRIIAATNRDLQSSLKAGRFRKDFFYRIHILPIYLPPLRLRKEDIPILVNQFANDFSRGEKISVVPQHVIDAMQDYDWPGNVRELQNTVHRYITLGSIDLHCLPRPTLDDAADALQELSPLQTDNPNLPLHDAINAFEKRYIEHLLNANQWHRSRVAELLGIDRRTLFRKMKAYGL